VNNADKWVSTLHRVILVVPPPSPHDDDNDQAITILGRRQSIAFFCNINGDAIVEPIGSEPMKKYPPISAKEHLMAKHLASMVADDDDDDNDDEL